MRIRITMDIDPEFADPDHAMGVTEAGYNQITDLLEVLGSNIDVARAET